MRAMLWLALAGAATGCLRKTSYRCESNEQCGTGGQCEETNYCSFADTNCTDGRRYSDLAGTNAGKCVGEETIDPDGGVDSPPGDVLADVPVGNCPLSYVAVSGQAHRYRVIANQANWSTQLAACDADGATTYLAVPDNQAELTAILAAANATIWVGITDEATENTFLTANGGTFPSDDPLWGGGEPDNAPESGTGNNNAHCVLASNDELSDDKCQNTYVAVCECEP